MFAYNTKLFKLTHFKTQALSIGNYLQIYSVKISMGDFLQEINFFRTILYSEIWIPFKIPVTHTSHSMYGLIERPFGRGKEYRTHSRTVLVTFWIPFKTLHWNS